MPIPKQFRVFSYQVTLYMAVKDLLRKIKETDTEPAVISPVVVPKKIEEPKETKYLAHLDKPLEELSFKELMEKETYLKSWLETHECQTGTNNTLDVNGRPYDQKKYEEMLDAYETTVVEIFARPSEECLEN